jgi:hypothetical protein
LRRREREIDPGVATEIASALATRVT